MVSLLRCRSTACVQGRTSLVLANPAALRYDRGDHFEDNEGYDMIYALYTLVVLVLIGCDQLLKSWTVSHLELGQSTGFLPGFLQLTRVHNYGAAWSSFSGKTVLLVAVTAVLLVAVAYLLLRRIVRHPLGVAAALLILGGGVGNIIDRIANGYVVDMFDLLLFDYPVFNLADCFVVVGVILGAVYYLWFYEKYDARKKDDATDADGDK